MYCDRRGTDKNHPGQNLPDKGPLTKPPDKIPREQLRENLYRGLLSGYFVLGLLKIGGFRDVTYFWVSGKCDRGRRGKNWPKNVLYGRPLSSKVCHFKGESLPFSREYGT